jgi:hypothetical protein
MNELKKQKEFIKSYYKNNNTIGFILIKKKYVYLLKSKFHTFNKNFDEKMSIPEYYNFLISCK